MRNASDDPFRESLRQLAEGYAAIIAHYDIAHYERTIALLEVQLSRPAHQPARPSRSSAGPQPPQGAGTVSDSDRVEIIWANNAIQQQWLEVIVKATPNTGLVANDVFFFGNEIGDTGVSNTSTVAKVAAGDVTGAQTHGASLAANIPITNIYDFDKDGKVSASDVTAAQTHGTSNATGLKLLVVGSSGPFAPEGASPSAAVSSDAAPFSGETGVASALASGSSSSSLTFPTLPTWIANRLIHLDLNHLDLNHGPIAKYFEHLAREHAPKAKSILVEADQIAEELGLEDELLEELVAGLKA